MFPTHPSDVITLSETDRSRLQTFVHRGQESARRRTRAQVLLKLGEGWSLEAVCAAFDVCRNTAVRVRQRFQEGGVDTVLTDQRQERYRQALTGPQQVHLIAVPAARSPMGTTTGRCGCSPPKPSSWALSKRSRLRPSGRS